MIRTPLILSLVMVTAFSAHGCSLTSRGATISGIDAQLKAHCHQAVEHFKGEAVRGMGEVNRGEIFACGDFIFGFVQGSSNNFDLIAYDRRSEILVGIGRDRTLKSVDPSPDVVGIKSWHASHFLPYHVSAEAMAELVQTRPQNLGEIVRWLSTGQALWNTPTMRRPNTPPLLGDPSAIRPLQGASQLSAETYVIIPAFFRKSERVKIPLDVQKEITHQELPVHSPGLPDALNYVMRFIAEVSAPNGQSELLSLVAQAQEDPYFWCGYHQDPNCQRYLRKPKPAEAMAKLVALHAPYKAQGNGMIHGEGLIGTAIPIAGQEVYLIPNVIPPDWLPEEITATGKEHLVSDMLARAKQLGSLRTAITTKDGFFRFENLPAGKYIVRCNMGSYFRHTQHWRFIEERASIEHFRNTSDQTNMPLDSNIIAINGNNLVSLRLVEP